MTTLITILQLLCGLAIIVMTMFQSGKNAGLSGAIGGGTADSFLAKNKSKTLDAKMARGTKWVGALFLVRGSFFILRHRSGTGRRAAAPRRTDEAVPLL